MFAIGRYLLYATTGIEGPLKPVSCYRIRANFDAANSWTRPSAELNQLVSWQRLQRHVSRPIPERLFVLILDPAPAIGGQALGGNRRAGDVSA